MFILSLVASGKSKGVHIKSADFHRAARRSGLWLNAETVHRSAITHARKKVPWTIFSEIFDKAVQVAYSLFPKDDAYDWHGMPVIAFDGSKYSLPATEKLRAEFDPHSGLQYEGKGHYPQCLVTTGYDVFRRIPVARSIVGIHGSERQEAKDLLPKLGRPYVLLFDRGYPSFDMITYLRKHHDGFFLFRCVAKSTFPAVHAFVKSGKKEARIAISPSNKYLEKLSAKERKRAKSIKLRAIRLVSPKGEVSVLLTNMFSKTKFPRADIIELYFRRWAVETHYKDEKVTLEIEKFHGKTPNSIRQELFSAAIMTVIARTLMAITPEICGSEKDEYQFKNAVMTLASEAAVLVPDDPQQAVVIFSEIIEAIERVKYYRPKTPRPTQPRITKRPVNKWCLNRRNKQQYA